MTKTAILSMLVLWLSACTSIPLNNPYALKAAGEAGIQATRIAEQSEANKAQREMNMLAVQQQATQVAAEIEAQRTLYAIEVTSREATLAADIASGQATQSAQATAGAFNFGATQVAQRATETAIAEEVKQEQFRREVKGYTDVGWLLLPICGLMGLAFILLVFLWKAGDFLLDVFLTKGRITDHRAGTVAWVEDAETGNLYPVLLSPGRVETPPLLLPPGAPKITVMGRSTNGEEQDEVYKLTASGSVLASPVAKAQRLPTDLKELTLDLLWKTTRADGFGHLSEELPGWRHLEGYSSGQWQRVVKALKYQGLAETGEDGTRLIGVNVGDLIYRIDTGKVSITPPPENAS